MDPLEILKIFTKLYGKPANSCQNISLKNLNRNLLVSMWEKSGDEQSHEHLHTITRLSIQYLFRYAVLTNVVVRLTDQSNEIANPWAKLPT